MQSLLLRTARLSGSRRLLSLNGITRTGCRNFAFSTPLRNAEVSVIDPTFETVEPTLNSLGLGVANSYFPPGLLQTLMETVHCDLGLPWWQTFIGATLCLRLVMFPAVIKMQRNAGRMAAHQPEIERLQAAALKETEQAKRHEAAEKLMAYMKENSIMPHQNLFPVVCNGVVISSMFFAIRGMCNCPVESLQTGGTSWFLDLCATDPYYALPALSCASLLLQIQLGADGMSALKGNVLHLMRFVAVGSFFVLTQFPMAINVYLLSSNVFSLFQAQFLKVPAVKSYFNIDIKKVK